MAYSHFDQIMALRNLRVSREGSELSRITVYTATIDPTEVAANSISAQTFAVTGLSTADTVIVNPGTNVIGIGAVRVTAANTLEVTFINPTATAIDPPSSTWKIIAIE